MGKYSFKTDFLATYPLPACAKYNPPCPSTATPRQFKKGDIIEGIEQQLSVNCIKAPCPSIVESVLTTDNLKIPINILTPIENLSKKSEERDAWTGGVEWDKVFSIRNLFWLVVVVYLFYLFMKHVLPLAKKSF